MTASKKITIVAGVVLALGLLAVGVLYVSFDSMGVASVSSKQSPDWKHTAKLRHLKLIDSNLSVEVDGTRVYRSPDFVPAPVDFREQLIWDAKSRRVLLEVAGKRLFGYDVIDKRPLTDEEIRDFAYTPADQLRFEGQWPGEPAKPK